MLCVLRLQKGGADGRYAVQCHVLNIVHAVVGGDLQPVQGQTVALLGAVKHLIVLLADLYLRAGTGLPQGIPQRGQRLRRKARHQQQLAVQLCRGDVAAPPERAAAGHQQGCGVPTVKPWDRETLMQKLDLALTADPMAIAMDIDAAGLPFLRNRMPPAGSKTVAELREVAEHARKPFILKGIMTVRGAEKAVEAGASAIVVSNHGGRVLDQCPATAEVLPAIADAVGDRVLVDGGIRTGLDVFKALALGADGVLIGRPFVTMVYGGGEEGVAAYVRKLADELSDTMAMCGAHSLKEINREMLWQG